MAHEAPIRVLYVDDNADDLRIARRAFKRYGLGRSWDVATADSVAGALQVMGSAPEAGGPFELLVVDYRLPDGSGLELLQQLRGDHPELPAIMVTGQGDERVAVEAMKLGAHDYLVKDEIAGPALARAARSAIERAHLAQQAQRQSELLREMAIRDELTKLFNRRHFLELLDREWQAAKRYQRELSLVLLDLDKFKNLNDTWGHLFGDEVLKETGAAIAHTLRDVDVAGRYGGEEFCVLLPDTDRDGATIAAERIRQAIARTHLTPESSSSSVAVTCSAGVASTADIGVHSVRDLVNCADKALFAAKDRGRNNVVVFNDLREVGGENPREGERRLEELTANFAGPIREFKSAYVKTIQALVEVAELREPHARGHSRQVAGYARQLGEGMKLRDHELVALVNAALLHDVGKVVVPERILQKPGPLTEDEWTLVKRHPLSGAQALQRALLLPDEVPAVVHHHEHWDGTGYPHGLAGERIPTAARIIAVADAYDAMTMGRAYEPVHTQPQAFDALRRDAGSHFDPEIVERFIECFEGQAPGAQALTEDQVGLQLGAGDFEHIDGSALSPAAVAAYAEALK